VIISQTPLRVSFVGGGTDLKAFYENDLGAVVSTTISRYIYVIIKKRFDKRIRVSYTQTEMVDSVDEIQHDLVREAMKVTGLRDGVEIVTMADVPSEGSGLGSSSSLSVGLLNAMYAYKGETRIASQLADEACQIEIARLNRALGKQDQYIAAFGGLRHIEFRPDESVVVTALETPNGTLERLSRNLMLFYTGITRSSSKILTEQQDRTSNNLDILRRMRDQCHTAIACLQEGNVDAIGELLHEGWLLKKQLAMGISMPEIEAMYSKVRKAGAIGGKIAGAGGGGFLLVYCPVACQHEVREVMYQYQELPFELDARGTRITFSIAE
jgi:D-glycero-alpha-D-manno-heptose-7-phosphate kinase